MRELGGGPASFARRIGRAGWRAFGRMLGGDDFTYAASVAYWALLSLFPFLLLVLSVVSAVTDDTGRAAVLGFVLDYFPARVEFIGQQIEAFQQTQLQVGLVSLAGLVWASLGFFGAVTTAVNYAWRVESPRGFWRHRLFTFLMLLAAGLMFVVAMALSSATAILEASRFSGPLRRLPGVALVEGLWLRSVSTVLLVGVLGLVYYFVPNVKVRFRSVWPGAVLAGVLWRLVFAAFAWFVADVSRLNEIHGSLTAVVMFLVWIYVSAVVMLYGAQFTAMFETGRNREDAPAAGAPDRLRS